MRTFKRLRDVSHARYLTAGLLVIWPVVCLGQGSTTPSAITLSSSTNPSVFGAPITLTATVSPSAATGKVTFYDGTTVLETKALASGQVTLTTSLLASGLRTLRAYYAGNVSYSASTSALVSQRVTSIPGNGFQSVVNYGVGSGPSLVAIGDFNGDGKADLAVTNFTSGNVSVLLGNGDGTFKPSVNFAVGINPSSVAIGDFNGDGKADLVVANTANGQGNLSVLLGNGDGTFQSAASLSSAANARHWS
jgi:hypothetical protein